MDIAEVKRQARQAAAKRRAAAHAELKDMAGPALAARGLPAGIGASGTVSGFIPYKSEIDTVPLLARLSREGWRTCLPVVIGADQPLLFRAWTPGEALAPGVWDIPIPPETAAEVLPDVLLVPMLAFDRQGYRLGYGGGFYDRTLAAFKLRPVTVGIAFDVGRIKSIGPQPHDVRLDLALTESGSL